MQTTVTEENYLKAIYKYMQRDGAVSTTLLSQELATSPASVTDMAKKMSEKGLVVHQPYRGVTLTDEGERLALKVIRKHRLWEVFLVEKLEFSWDEVHETAEELEHIHSPELIEKLDQFLNFPRFDPHGDPIPDEHGTIHERNTVPLLEVAPGQEVSIAAVLMDSPEFLRYLDRLHFTIGTRLEVLEHIPFDDSRLLRSNGRELIINRAVAENILVMHN
jgi:DtxR family Mn-dependent transcriptional regulator